VWNWQVVQYRRSKKQKGFIKSIKLPLSRGLPGVGLHPMLPVGGEADRLAQIAHPSGAAQVWQRLGLIGQRNVIRARKKGTDHDFHCLANANFCSCSQP